MSAGLRPVLDFWMGFSVDICERLANNSLDVSLVSHPAVGALEVSRSDDRGSAAWDALRLADVL